MVSKEKYRLHHLEKICFFFCIEQRLVSKTIIELYKIKIDYSIKYHSSLNTKKKPFLKSIFYMFTYCMYIGSNDTDSIC